MLRLLFFFLLFSPQRIADADYWSNYCDTTSNQFNISITYQSNLKNLSNTIPLNASTSNSLFAKGYVDSGPDEVAALALCRGDITSSSCLSCLTGAFIELPQLCAYMDAAIYYDTCLVSYSNDLELLADYDFNRDLLYGNSTIDISDPRDTAGHSFYNTQVVKLLNATAPLAASNVTRRLATSMMVFNESITVYGLEQCTPDMSESQCSSCLRSLIDQVPHLYKNAEGARSVGLRCNIRYENNDKFYDGDPTITIAGPPPPLLNGRKKEVNIVTTIVPVVVFLLLMFLLLFFVWVRRKNRGNQNSEEHSQKIKQELQQSEFCFFDFSEMIDATDNFSVANKLGEGGYGPVYKGQLLDGRTIAVKRLSAHSGQGLEQFKNEIQLIAKLQHANLVGLLGCCIQGEEKILVYEYMPNKSLDLFIFDQAKGKLLNWNIRLQIIEGIAQGLVYLHKHSRLRVIHRDLKVSNILLDDNMNPKISDFGIARIYDTSNTQPNTNRIIGTYGYMPPEYVYGGKFSIKSDVFSFGVILLEIISGKRNVDFQQYGDNKDLLGYAWHLWREERSSELVDPLLDGKYQVVEVMRCIHIALLCVHGNPVDRPTMSEIIMMISSKSISFPEPKQPAFFDVGLSVGESSYPFDTSGDNMLGR